MMLHAYVRACLMHTKNEPGTLAGSVKSSELLKSPARLFAAARLHEAVTIESRIVAFEQNQQFANDRLAGGTVGDVAQRGCDGDIVFPAHCRYLVLSGIYGTTSNRFNRRWGTSGPTPGTTHTPSACCSYAKVKNAYMTNE